MKDPICGMELTEGKEHSRLVLKGKGYYFCSETCEIIFKKINGDQIAGDAGLGDIERKMVAYNTLKQLAVTVAHYIGNANAAISAQAQIHDLPMIEEQSAKIDTVVKALLSISDIRLQKYVDSEEDAIFDLRNTLEGKLKNG